MKYRRYAAYKESGVEWLGEVPSHWEVKRLRHCCQLRNEKVSALEVDLPYLGLENIESRSGKIIVAEAVTESEGTANRHYPGDVLFGKLRPYLAKVLESQTHGICTTELLVLQPLLATSTFLKYYLLTDQFINIVDSSTYGAKMPRAGWEFISNMAVPVPTREEQQAIAAFLDRETAQIDVLIARQERLLAVLQEKRQALISHAVTKGLDPQAAMKESGVEWLGEVPSHWEVVSLRRLLATIEQGQTLNSENRPVEAGEWGVLKSGCVNGGKFRDEENKALAEGATFNPADEVKVGDILMSRASGSLELVGSVALVEDTRPGLLLSDKTFRLIPTDVIIPRFLVAQLTSRHVRNQIRLLANGAEGLPNNITKPSINSLIVTLPPMKEQQALVDSLACSLAEIEGVLVRSGAMIALLQERRAALISAAVTGKIDVRELPDRVLPEGLALSTGVTG